MGLLTSTLSTTFSVDLPAVGPAVGTLTALAMFTALRRRRRPTRFIDPEETFRARSFAQDRIQVPSDPVETPALVAAWSQAQELLPRSSTQRLARTRLACRAILNDAETNPHDFGAIEQAMLVNRHVPSLVQEAVTLCRGASSTEEARYKAELLDGLESLGSRGTVLQAKAAESFRARLLHIRRRTGPTI